MRLSKINSAMLICNNYNKSNCHITFSATQSLKIGSNIKNVGLIVNSFKLQNNITNKLDKSYLIYKKTDKGGVFSLLKAEDNLLLVLSEKIEKSLNAQNLLKKYNYYTIPPILDKLRAEDSSIADLYENLRISECGFIKVLNPVEKDSIIYKGYKPIDENDLVFIEDYYATKQKVYPFASRIPALATLQALKQNGYGNILAIAQGIGEKSASPVNLYLRVGFCPLKHTLEEINSHMVDTPKGKRIEATFAVPMYLTKDGYCYNLASKCSYLDKINQMDKSWF